MKNYGLDHDRTTEFSDFWCMAIIEPDSVGVVHISTGTP